MATISRMLKNIGLFCKTYKRDLYSAKRHIFLSILLIVATPYWFVYTHAYLCTHICTCLHLCLYLSSASVSLFVSVSVSVSVSMSVSVSVCISTRMNEIMCYGVATISSLLKIKGFFCRISSF